MKPIVRFGVTTNRARGVLYWQLWAYLPGATKPTKRNIGRKDEYSERSAKWKANEIVAGLTGEGAADKGLTIKDWCSRQIERLAGELEGSTIKLFRDTEKELYAYFGEGRKMVTITREEAADFRALLAKRKTTRADKMADATVCRKCAKARELFKAAVDLDKIPFNPFDRVRTTPAKTDQKYAAITLEQLDKLLDACPNDGWRAAFALSRLAGLRINEIESLAWGDVRLGEKHPTLTAHARTTKRSTKKRTRVVPISGKLAGILQGIYDEAPDKALGPAVGLPKNNRYTLAEKYMVDAGLVPWACPFHAGRSNAVSDWLAKGLPAADAAAWAGHSIKVMADTYHQTRPEILAKATDTDVDEDIPSPARKTP